MKKRVLCIILALLLLIPLVGVAEEPIKLKVNGKYVQTDVDPFIENGRTLVPVRFVAEGLCLNVIWGAEEQKVIVYYPGDENTCNGIMFMIGHKFLYEDSEDAMPIDAALSW